VKRLPNNVELHPLWVEGVESNNLGDINRLYFLYMNVKAVVDHGIPGAFAELGVYKGNSAKLVCDPGATSGLPYRRHQRHGRGPAPEPGEKRDGGVVSNVGVILPPVM